MTAESKKSVTVEHVRAVTPGRDLGLCGIRMEGGRIVAVGPDVRPGVGDEILDGTGLTAVPGFIDIHSHGRSGADFCDATDAAFATIGHDKLKDGGTRRKERGPRAWACIWKGRSSIARWPARRTPRT